MIPKFRAWHKKEKRMYEVITVAYDYRGTGKLAEVDCLNPLGAEHDALEFRANEIELHQWTGLCDRNGVEIYEGDIIHSGDNEEKYIPYLDWSSEAFELCKVIGNVYENPELLEGE